MAVTVKKDPYVWAFSGFLVACAFAAVYLKLVEFRVATAFLAGALALPSLLGSTPKAEEDGGDRETPIPKSDQ